MVFTMIGYPTVVLCFICSKHNAAMASVKYLAENHNPLKIKVLFLVIGISKQNKAFVKKCHK